MDFFQRQEHARRNTGRLVLLFVLGVTLMLVTVYAIAAGVFLRERMEKGIDLWWWDPRLCAGATLGTLAIIAGGSLFKTLELSKGGSVVASALGGVPVDPHSTDPDRRKLLNVVEEMSIASGVPMPEVYVMPEEQGINAFAAGTAPDNAVIGVTQGCIRHLSRDELQGVVAHEYSHILNGDMRLNLRLMGWIFGILCVMLLGRVLLESMLRGGGSRRRSRSDNGKNNAWPILAIGLALLVIGWLGAFFGRLIQAAVSRQREFLADAAAVQFTRNPLGLAGALKKIGGAVHGSKLASPHAAEASHMFFCNGLNKAWFNVTATHPPLDQRIRLLDPAWDGQFPAILDDESSGRDESIEPPAPRSRRRPPPLQAAQLHELPGLAAAAAAAPGPVRAGEVIQHFGAATPAHLAFAAEFKQNLPASLSLACQEPLAASALVYGLLLGLTPENLDAQVAKARGQIDAPAHLELARLAADLAGVDPSHKLTLALMTLPALRRMTPAQFQHFDATVRALAEADQQLDLFEYALLKAIFRHLRPHFTPVRRASPQYYALGQLLPDCAILLSALAHVGHAEPGDLAQAFRAGAAQLRDGARLSLQPLEASGLTEIDAALNRLAQATPMLKKQLLNACAHVVAADQIVHSREAELLRAIADTLDCPIPPFLSGV